MGTQIKKGVEEMSEYLLVEAMHASSHAQGLTQSGTCKSSCHILKLMLPPTKNKINASTWEHKYMYVLLKPKLQNKSCSVSSTSPPFAHSYSNWVFHHEKDNTSWTKMDVHCFNKSSCVCWNQNWISYDKRFSSSVILFRSCTASLVLPIL